MTMFFWPVTPYGRADIVAVLDGSFKMGLYYSEIFIITAEFD
jgi:hypothetical protein